MSQSGIVKYTLRLNVQNEKHEQLARTLNGLNKDVYKSQNQFMIDALISYIASFEERELVHMPQKQIKYLTAEDLEDIRREIREEVKDEIIRVLSGAFAAGAMYQATSPMETQEKELGRNIPKDEKMTDLAQMWG